MPIADVLGHREFEIGHELGGTEWRVSRRYSHTGSLEVGLFDRFEVGFETDYQGNTVYNGKFNFFKNEKNALSVGVTEMVEGSASPFLVGRHDFNGFRLHGGWLQDETDQLVVGIDFPTPFNGVGALDFASGPEGAVWAGWTVAIPKCNGLSFGASVGVPLKHGEPVGHTLSLTYGFRL